MPCCLSFLYIKVLFTYHCHWSKEDLSNTYKLERVGVAPRSTNTICNITNITCYYQTDRVPAMGNGVGPTVMSTAFKRALICAFLLVSLSGVLRSRSQVRNWSSSSAGRLEPETTENINQVAMPGTAWDFNLNPRIVYRKLWRMNCLKKGSCERVLASLNIWSRWN